MFRDIHRWDQKYRKKRTDLPSLPDAVLVSLERHLRCNGWALDVACGRGSNTGYLADLGYDVLGIDCSREALEQARRDFGSDRTHWLAADFDQFFFPCGFFELVVIVRFIDRKLTSALVDSLIPGGWLFHRTFNVNHLEWAPSFNRQFILSRGELLDLYADLNVVESNDEPDNSDPLSYLLARKNSVD